MGGLEVLRNIEQVPTDEHDRPTRPLMIAKAVVLVNPFEELDEVLKRELEFEKKRRGVMEQQVNVEKQPVKVEKPGVGKQAVKVEKPGVGKQAVKVEKPGVEKKQALGKQAVRVEKQAADKKQVGEETGDDDAGDRKEANSNWNGSQPSPKSRQ